MIRFDNASVTYFAMMCSFKRVTFRTEIWRQFVGSGVGVGSIFIFAISKNAPIDLSLTGL